MRSRRRRIIELLRRLYPAWGPWTYNASEHCWDGAGVALVPRSECDISPGGSESYRTSYWFRFNAEPDLPDCRAGGIW